jgi:hypothetical protein
VRYSQLSMASLLLRDLESGYFPVRRSRSLLVIRTLSIACVSLVFLISSPYRASSADLDTLDQARKTEAAENFFTAPAKYLKIYLQNRKAFAPFSREKRTTPKEQAVLLYHHLCQNHKIKPECKKYRKKLVSFFEERLTLIDRSPIESSPESEAIYVEQLDQVVQKLKRTYQETRNKVDQELSLALFSSTEPFLKPQSAQEYNQTVQTVFEKDPVHNAVQSYRDSYWAAAEDFHGEILLSNTFHGRIEGNFFNVLFSDVILSMDELTQETRKDFEETLINHPEIATSSEEAPQETVIEFASRLLKDDLRSDWDRANHLLPHIADDETFTWIQAFHSNDIALVRLLARKQYQRAIWRLLDLGYIEKAEHLEEIFTRSIMASENIEAVAPLGGGVTTTQLVRFKDGNAGVFKPKPWSKKGISFIQNIQDTFASHYQNEIAAYRISSNKMVGLNLVPITQCRTIEGSIGSLQNYVNYATLGRSMQAVEIKHPKRAGRFTHPRGRTALPRDVRLFDWLIDNHDRNIGNFLLADDGRVILIDHSWSFVNALFLKPGHAEMNAMFPSEQIYENIKRLSQHPEIMDEQLKDLISCRQLYIFKKKINFISKFVTQRILAEGRDQVFPNQK